MIPRTQLTLGRQLYWDLIGLSGLDGASVQVSLPAQFRVNVRGGWSLRNEWSPLSPTLLQPVGNDEAHAGYIVSAGLEYGSFGVHRAGLQYRRVFDADIQSEEIGLGTHWLAHEVLALKALGIGISCSTNWLKQNCL